MTETLEFRPYWPGDARLIRLRSAQAHEAALMNDITPHDPFYTMGGTSQTLVLGRKHLAAAGLSVVWEGRAKAWALFSDMRPRQWLMVFHRLKATINASPALRIEATCLADFPAGRRFLERLGFESEGTLRKYSAGVDHLMMARVRP